MSSDGTGAVASWTVVIVDPKGQAWGDEVIDLLNRCGCDVVTSTAAAESEIIDAVRDADGVITTGDISRRVMESLSRCRVIARSSIGMDKLEGVDVASAKGIVLCNMPGIIEQEVADHTMALLLAVARRVVELDRYVRRGEWRRGKAVPTGNTLHISGSVLGLVGMGRIAQAVAQRASAFGLTLAAYDPFASAEVYGAFGVRRVTFAEVLQGSDFVSLHVPLTAETRHMIGAKELKLMRANAILVNTARGAVVDGNALAKSLEAGEIAGAALDVMEDEPIGDENPLCGLPNVVLTPHWASRSIWTDRAWHLRPAEEVAAVLAGLRPRAVWNPEVLDALGLR